MSKRNTIYRTATERNGEQQKIGIEKLTQPTNKTKIWMTNEIIHFMNERRSLKNKNEFEYKQIPRLINNPENQRC